MEKLLAPLLGFCLLLSGCDSQKGAAESAFAQLQAAVAPVSAELDKYAPEAYAQLNVSLQEMKRHLNSKDYAAVLALQPTVMQQLIQASSAAARASNQSGKQLSAEWKQLGDAVPALVLQLSERLSELQDRPQLPAGISKAYVQEVAAALPEVGAEWSAAVAAAKANDLGAAIAKARAIQKRCVELGARLGINPGIKAG